MRPGSTSAEDQDIERITVQLAGLEITLSARGLLLASLHQQGSTQLLPWSESRGSLNAVGTLREEGTQPRGIDCKNLCRMNPVVHHANRCKLYCGKAHLVNQKAKPHQSVADGRSSQLGKLWHTEPLQSNLDRSLEVSSRNNQGTAVANDSKPHNRMPEALQLPTQQ